MAKSSSNVGTVLFIVFLIGAGLYLYQYATSSPYRLSSEDAKQLVKNKEVDVILDVRTDLERSTLGYYPDSVHIQGADLEQQISVQYPNKDTRILIYCNTGHRARMATEKLQSLGYKNTHYISSSYTTLL